MATDENSGEISFVRHRNSTLGQVLTDKDSLSLLLTLVVVCADLNFASFGGTSALSAGELTDRRGKQTT